MLENIYSAATLGSILFLISIIFCVYKRQKRHAESGRERELFFEALLVIVISTRIAVGVILEKFVLLEMITLFVWGRVIRNDFKKIKAKRNEEKPEKIETFFCRSEKLSDLKNEAIDVEYQEIHE